MRFIEPAIEPAVEPAGRPRRRFIIAKGKGEVLIYVWARGVCFRDLGVNKSNARDILT